MSALSDRIRPIASRLIARVRDGFFRRSWWLTSQSRDLHGRVAMGSTLLSVIGVEYCREVEQSFPRMRLGDIKRAIDLASPNTWNFLDVTGESAEQIKVVITHVDKNDFLSSAGGLLWVPETTLLRRDISDASIYSVDRDGMFYFLTRKHACRLAGGMVKTPTVFALANGLDSADVRLISSDSELLEFIQRGLARLTLRDLRFMPSPVIARRWRVFRRPAAITTVIALVGYLALSSLYLLSAEEFRGRQMTSLGSDVDALLDAQREIDMLTSRRNLLLEVLRERQPTWRIWESPPIAWQQQGGISSLGWQDGKLKVAGTVPAATNFLESLSKADGIIDPRFSSAVRQESIGQTFSVQADTRWGAQK